MSSNRINIEVHPTGLQKIGYQFYQYHSLKSLQLIIQLLYKLILNFFSGYSRLILKKATKADSGVYECEAKNENSRATSSTAITVEGTYKYSTRHYNINPNLYFQVFTSIQAAQTTSSSPIVPSSLRQIIVTTNITPNSVVGHVLKLVYYQQMETRLEVQINTHRYAIIWCE